MSGLITTLVSRADLALNNSFAHLLFAAKLFAHYLCLNKSSYFPYMLRRSFIKRTGAAGLIGFIAPENILSTAQHQSEFNLESLFQDPPGSAFPQVFWFWMNGNISREGITRDLEAMKEAGIGGVFNFDVGTGVPKGPVAYASAEWTALKRLAMQEAERF